MSLRVRVMSDLHLEFRTEPGRDEFIEELPVDCDVLVLAGDIDTHGIEASLSRFCARFPQIVYVHGNHELYGTDPVTAASRIDRAAARLSNLHWLDGDRRMLTPGGARFLGGTMWFPRPADEVAKRCMTDFSVIRDFEPWVYEENARTVAMLRRHLRPGDVVVTHHLPSFTSVRPKYAGNVLNKYFVCDVEDVMRDAKPALWIHGHTHESVDYDLHGTRVVCNPYGYFPRGLNPRFDPGFTVEVGT